MNDPAAPLAEAGEMLPGSPLPEGPEASTQLPHFAVALRHRDFRLFWSGNFLSNIGTWMQNVAQGWLVLQITNSAFWLGVVGFASTIPFLLFALVGGVIADHVDKRKLLLVTQSVMMVIAFTMAALAYWKVIRIWEIGLLGMGTGIAMALNTPGYQVLVPRLVPREELTNAIALNSAQYNMSRVLGPTLGGLAMAVVGVAGNFFLNGLSFLAVILALTRIHYGKNVALEEGHLWFKMKQGFAYVFGRPEMRALVLLVAIASLLVFPYLTFIPYFARDVLHSDAKGLGVLMACAGAGSFVAAGTIAYLGKMHHRGRFVVRSAMGFYLAIIAFSFSHLFYLSCALLTVAGFFMILMAATMNSLLQHLAEDEMRGRTMSIYSTAFLGLPPIGSLITGSLTHLARPAFVIAGMAALAAVATFFLYNRQNALRELD
ncbi:MAG TPA: MFS transporter [Alphaproteobacteria bacterium]|nr:MFS transporter [Alphaproteobacteria bacterium]